MRNPFEQAADVIGRIEEVLSEVPLSGELFPNIENPFRPSAIPDVVGQVNQLINQTQQQQPWLQLQALLDKAM